MDELQQRYARSVDALNRGAWREAFDLASELLSKTPAHAGVHFVAGVAALELQEMPRALGHLGEAVKRNPRRADYCAQFARALARASRMREAMAVADEAVSAGPQDAMTFDTLGVLFTHANEHAKAAPLYARAVELAPNHPVYRFNLATSLTFIGDVAAAEHEYEACLRLNPKHWKAHLALTHLRKHSRDDNHLSRLRALLPSADETGRMYLHLALSRELEDMEEYEQAFGHLLAGKTAGRERRAYSPERDAALFEELRAAFSAPLPAGEGHPSTEPIFVIGMPRSGTTLVDRILSSHPEVESAGELQNFGVILKRASGSMTQALLDADTIRRARAIDPAGLGGAYLSSTRNVTGRSPRFVDKLPHNFLYAGFIARSLPNARIVCLRRNPMDTCLGNFRQLFTEATRYYDYSFDLLDTGRYFIQFDRLMKHWRSVLPGRIVEIEYERLVEEQEATTRRLLEWCGLPWNEQCLRFEDNQAPVATASTVQVRSPMFRSSMQRWKRYEPQLRELRGLLEGAGIEV